MDPAAPRTNRGVVTGTPRTILITGATGAIGAALARAYADAGTLLALIGRDPARLAQVSAVCRERGARVEPIELDVTAFDVLRVCIDEFDTRHPVDLAIANAGVASTLAREGPGESWETVLNLFQTNTLGALATLHPLIERMRARRCGQIAVVSSLGAYAGMPISPAYSASKAAIKVYAEGLRGWLAPQGVKVNVICPGFVRSDMSARFPGPTPFLLDPDRAARIIRRGLERDRARIAFPFPLNLGVWALSVLPPTLGLKVQKWLGFY